MNLKKMARVAWKMAPKYQKNAKWPKITFRGPILVPEVAFWGFWGLVCIEKWSRNFDWGTRSAIFGTPQNAQNGSFWVFLAILGVLKMALWVPESKF